MQRMQICPRFERAVEILSKRWTTLIVYQLLEGPQRFVAIENSLTNLSSKVLSERLKELEEEGIIERTVYPEKPVRIEYALTSKGQELAPLMEQISEWSTKWIELPSESDDLQSDKSKTE
ncbi:winged helix-turn-helix transcriptional regulator [Paenibacillus daejeonensis]|uniref:winged helix-turn-helix transcriptional regulator n=1 Tax=Paenibacillus daejeonensis TaxID=135193 RepID=UPI00036EC2BC|nr:helix-turn-helix domain-containing protein [Paenibacillus daejeonensis]